MTPQDTIDRVAKAIHGAQFEDEWESVSEIERVLFWQCAIAAIKALGESFEEFRRVFNAQGHV